MASAEVRAGWDDGGCDWPGKKTVHCRLIVGVTVTVFVAPFVVDCFIFVVLAVLLASSRWICASRFCSASRSCSNLDFQFSGAPRFIPTDADCPSKRFPAYTSNAAAAADVVFVFVAVVVTVTGGGGAL